MPSPIFIGEAPGPQGKPGCPLFPLPLNSAGARLCRMTGLPKHRYLRCTRRLNLLAEYPGDKWPVAAARAQAQNLIGSNVLRAETVVLVGRRVADAFVPRGLAPLERRGLPIYDITFVHLPHPSGRNPWYNDAANRAAAETLVRELIEGAA